MKRPIYLIILLLLQMSITAQALNKENNDTLNRRVAIAIKNKKINISKFAPANKNCALGLYYLAEKRDTARAIPLLREAAHLGNNYSRGVLVNYYSHASKNYFLAYYYYCDNKWELAVGIINLLLITISLAYLLLQAPDFIINKLWREENRLQRGLEDGNAKCQFEKAKQIFIMLRVNLNENSFKYYANGLSILFLVVNISVYLHNIIFEDNTFLENVLEVSKVTIAVAIVYAIIIVFISICSYLSYNFDLYKDVRKAANSLYIYLAILCCFVFHTIQKRGIDMWDISTWKVLGEWLAFISFPLVPLLAMRYKTNDAIFLCRTGLISICLICCLFFIGIAADIRANIDDITIIAPIVRGVIAIICIGFQIRNIRKTFDADFEKFIPKEERKIGACGIVYAIYFAIFHIFLFLWIITENMKTTD